MADLPFPLMGLPLSGPVTQAIAPVFAGQVDVTYAGDPGIEREVVAEVASFGTQLGVLTDAVLALAGDDPDPCFVALRKLARKVRKVKKRRRRDAEARAREALDALGRADPDALSTLLATFPRPRHAADERR